jgi:hypothetical protein
MKKLTTYLLLVLCISEAVCITWLWPRASRITPRRDTRDPSSYTILRANPGEAIKIETSDPGIAVEVWENGPKSHAAMQSRWGDTIVAIGLWPDDISQSIKGGYTKYRKGAFTSSRDWDEDGVPTKMAKGPSTFALTTYDRKNIEWIEAKRSK